MSAVWNFAQVRAAKTAIRAAFPDVVIAEGDYGLSLGVKHPNADVAIIVFQAERKDINQPRVRTPLSVVGAWLRHPVPPFYGLNTHPRREP